MDVGLLSWKYSVAIWKRKTWSPNIFQRCFKWRGLKAEVSSEEKCLGKCITNLQVLLLRFKFHFTHKRARRGTFRICWGTSVFSFTRVIPSCLRSPDKTHKYQGRGNLSMLRWDSNCLMVTDFYYFLLPGCYGTLASEVVTVVPRSDFPSKSLCD